MHNINFKLLIKIRKFIHIERKLLLVSNRQALLHDRYTSSKFYNLFQDPIQITHNKLSAQTK